MIFIPFPLQVLLLAYLAVNLLAFHCYGRDKRSARAGRRRTSERALLVVSFLGPFGAVLGMRHFRHKTQKLKFKLVWAFAVLHVCVIGYLLWWF
jgi:uncharacterized membrane protein YsdA (DUF1294 family)